MLSFDDFHGLDLLDGPLRFALCLGGDQCSHGVDTLRLADTVADHGLQVLLDELGLRRQGDTQVHTWKVMASKDATILGLDPDDRGDDFLGDAVQCFAGRQHRVVLADEAAHAAYACSIVVVGVVGLEGEVRDVDPNEALVELRFGVRDQPYRKGTIDSPGRYHVKGTTEHGALDDNRWRSRCRPR